MSLEQLVGVYIASDEAEILSIKVTADERVRKGSLLFSCRNRNEAAEAVIKSTVVGVVKEVVVKEGTCVTKQ